MVQDVEKLIKAAVSDITNGRHIPDAVSEELERCGITVSMLMDRIHKKLVGNASSEFIKTVGLKTSLLCNLIWDMVDSIIDYCALYKIGEVKVVSRALRELKREYDRFRASAINTAKRQQEDENAEIFRELYKNDLSDILNSVMADVSSLNLTKEESIFINAVHRAIAMGEALKLYGAWADLELKKQGGAPAKYSFIQNSMLKALELIPLFAGDCLLKNFRSCEPAARLLFSRITEMDITIPEEEI